MEIILSGVPILAKDHTKWHIVTSVHSRENFVEQTLTLVKKQIFSHSQIAASFAKRAVNQSMDSGLQGNIEHERCLIIDLMVTYDFKEGVKLFLEKRPAKFTNQ